jgi:hypothetical protein
VANSLQVDGSPRSPIPMNNKALQKSHRKNISSINNAPKEKTVTKGKRPKAVESGSQRDCYFNELQDTYKKMEDIKKNDLETKKNRRSAPSSPKFTQKKNTNQKVLLGNVKSGFWN